MAQDNNPSIYKTFKKSNTVDTPYLAIEMKAVTTDKVKNPLQNAKKFYHCSFKGCLGIIFIYILIYSLSYM